MKSKKVHIAPIKQQASLPSVEHDSASIRIACEEEMFLRFLLGDVVVRITHISATDVPGVLTRPIIDLLLEVDAHTAIEESCRLLEAQGYVKASEHVCSASAYVFLKEYEGHMIHVMLCYEGDYDAV